MSTWVGRYSIVGGQVQEHGPWLVDRQRRREDESLRLLVLAEPTDARSAELCHEVAEAIAALFAREALSVTGGLLRALRQAHANLAEWNRRSLREHRVAVGITCVAIRDGQATIAQLGRGVVYVAGPDGTQRLTTEGTAAATPLGMDDQVEPRFHAIPLAGRRLLLLTGAADTVLGEEIVRSSLDAGPERALGELFRHSRGIQEMTAVLVADLDLDTEQEADPLDEEPGVPTPVRAATREVDSGPTAAPSGAVGSGHARVRLPAVRRGRTVGRAGGAGHGVPWRLVGAVGGIAVAIALLAVTVLPRLLTEDRAAELEKAIATATQKIETAESAGSPGDQRQALQDALEAVERARAIASDDPRVAALEDRARARLGLLDAVTNVQQLTTLVTFSGAVTAPVNPDEIVVGGRGVWVLESARGRIIRVDAQGGSALEVFRAGENYEKSTARDPVSIAWDTAKSRLIVLDAGRTFFAIPDDTAAKPVPLTVRGIGDLKSAVAISAYLGNLYVLDSAGGEVWRYPPASDGFDSERTGVLGGAELGQASEIEVDGDTFILDGASVRHFRQGRELPHLFAGVDRPLQSPTAIGEDLLRGIIYAADRGNRRIIAGDREGAFQRQYRHADFGDLRGVAVTADGSRVYVLSGDRVSWFQPQPPAAPPATPTPSATGTPTATSTGTATGTARPGSATPTR